MKEHVILFIDDEETVVELGKEMLEDIGYKVITQTNSEEALEIFRGNPQSFDLVITDYNMPRLMGDQLAIKLRKIRINIPIILCTACKNISMKKIQKWGINDLITKPYTTEEIDSAIQRILSKF